MAPPVCYHSCPILSFAVLYCAMHICTSVWLCTALFPHGEEKREEEKQEEGRAHRARGQGGEPGGIPPDRCAPITSDGVRCPQPEVTCSRFACRCFFICTSVFFLQDCGLNPRFSHQSLSPVLSWLSVLRQDLAKLLSWPCPILPQPSAYQDDRDAPPHRLIAPFNP